MSLSRLALRLATMEALCPSAAHAGSVLWPTLAGRYIYDSRIDPFDDDAEFDRRLVAAVYTEEDNSDSAQKSGGPPYRVLVDLVIEMSVIVGSNDSGQTEIGIPQTDAEMEALIDLFEGQVKFVLHYGQTGAIWRALTGRRILDIRSLPHRTSEDGVRLAMRTLRMKVVVPDDCFDAAPSAAPEGLDRLPQPLRTVVSQLSETSYGAALAEMLAPAAPVMPVATPLSAVGMKIDVARAAGTGDGIIDVEAEAESLQD